MTWQAWLSVAVTVGAMVGMAATNIAVDILFMAALTVLLLAGVLDAKEAFAGFSNEGMLTVALLYVVVAGVRDTGGVTWVARYMFGKPTSVGNAQIRLMFPVTFLSAWINNTPVVAMLLPAVLDWGKKYRISPSKLMIPLSYASIIGGCTTLIGTSTNLVVQGLLIKSGEPGLGMFTITPVGLPCAIVAVIAVILASRWMLPDRQPVLSLGDDARQYTVEMIIDEKGALVGKTIEEAGLRHLVGAYLAEVDRGDEIFPVVGPTFVLHANDRLVFVGVVDSIVDLNKIPGLLPAGDQLFKLDSPRPQRTLIEAVVSDRCPLVGQSIREGRFRNVYNAVVIAVARGGERIIGKLGDVVLRAGDTLLLEARPSFVVQQRNSRDFYLVSRVADSNPIRHNRSIISVVILTGLIVAVSTGLIDILPGALLAGGLMLATRCTSTVSARNNIDWKVLIVIAAAFGLGTALTKTGAAEVIAGSMSNLAGPSPWLNLVVIYVATMIFTEILSNNAAAALMFPIAMALSKHLNVSYMPFIVGIMLAASFGFATPIGYQTHLMVYGPGGYKFSDFVRIGVFLDILLGVVAVAIIPLVFKF